MNMVRSIAAHTGCTIAGLPRFLTALRRTFARKAHGGRSFPGPSAYCVVHCCLVLLSELGVANFQLPRRLLSAGASDATLDLKPPPTPRSSCPPCPDGGHGMGHLPQDSQTRHRHDAPVRAQRGTSAPVPRARARTTRHARTCNGATVEYMSREQVTTVPRRQARGGHVACAPAAGRVSDPLVPRYTH